MFDVLDRLEEEFPHHTFGANKEGQLFVDGQITKIKWSKVSDVEPSEKLEKEAIESVYKEMRKILLKNKLIKKEKEEE